MAANNTRQNFVDALEYAYGPILISVVFTYLLASQDAVFEVFLAMSDDLGSVMTLSFAPIRALTAILSFIFVPVMLFIAAEATLFARHKRLDPAIDRKTWTWSQWTKEEAFLLSTLGRLPLLGAGIGLIRAARLDEASDAQFYILGILGVVSFLIAVVGYLARHKEPLKSTTERMIETGGLWSGVMLAMLLPALIIPQFSEIFGPITVTSFAVVWLAFFFSALTDASSRSPGTGHFPLIFVVAALLAAANSASTAVLLTIFGLIAFGWFWYLRRHWSALLATAIPTLLFGLYAVAPSMIRHCDALSGCNIIEIRADDPRPTVADLAKEWTPPAGQPIRILAAQGGGLFAAYQTAYYLAAKADMDANNEEADPDFLDSLFAISGVSGGSFGAAAFWAIYEASCMSQEGATTRTCTCQDADPSEPANQCYRQKVRKALRRDYLSSPLTGLLFRDALDSLLPFSGAFKHPIDRGRLLEKELEDNLAAVTKTDLLSKPVETAGFARTPHLFFNATHVQTGEAVVNGPVRLKSENGHVIHPGPAGLSMSTAAVLSARFPLVTPPGRYVVDGSVHQVVDGGYFDNSGIETAVEIVAAFDPPINLFGAESIALKKTIELISFEIIEEKNDAQQIKGTIGAPVGAFYNSWISRRILSERRLNFVPDKTKLVPKSVPIDTGDFNFTLSWLLTEGTFDMIECQIEKTALVGAPDLATERCN